jgi:hypothetical protein
LCGSESVPLHGLGVVLYHILVACKVPVMSFIRCAIQREADHCQER